MQDNERVFLTKMTTCGGCAAKIAPGVLQGILSGIPMMNNENLLVGFDKSDDAAVYKVTDDIAIVQTVDFFPPMVDDPYTFGQVAAANALSDVYAMGGTPKLALNLLCFPNDLLAPQHVQAILLGGADKVREAGAVLCGGHTIYDEEPKYGLSVTGFVHPKHILTNSAAMPGDMLILTKPIGVGILNNAAKAGLLDSKQSAACIQNMTTLNAKAAKAMQNFDVHACTDVTGFSLVGHSLEMADGSGVTIALFSNNVPLLDGALEFAQKGVMPGGLSRNKAFALPKITLMDSVSSLLGDVLFDPQTSGGLLISVSASDAPALLAMLRDSYENAAIVGEVRQRGVVSLIIE